MKIPKPFLFLFAAVAAFGAFGALHPAQAHAQESASYFYDNLGPYGEWVDDPDYGYVWHPTSVDDNWAPYTDGYWAYTDQGWTWVSYEDYGAIVYHYGRWAHVPGEGWVWVPGTQWAPAWVSWRSNDDYVGWAPLPPEAHFHVGIGFGSGIDAQFDIGPGFYSFVGVGDFGAPALGPVILDRSRNVTIINNTTNITNITVNNTNIYNGGPKFATIAARSTRPIPTLKLVRQTGPGANGKLLSHQQGNSLVVVAPKITAPTNGKFPAPPKVAKTLTGVKADHGWAGTDPSQHDALQKKFKAEGGSASAKAINPADIKLVTDKAKGPVTPKNSFTDGGEGAKGGKTPKQKNTENTDLINAPATDAGGASTPASSPKGKGKKGHLGASPGDQFNDANGANDGSGKKQREFENTTGNGSGEAPTPKVKKSKKTPSDSDSGTGESSNKRGDGSLQPFMAGGDNPTPKVKKPSNEYSDEGSKNIGGEGSKRTDFSNQGGPNGAGPNGDGEGKKTKGKNKNKGEGQPTPQD